MQPGNSGSNKEEQVASPRSVRKFLVFTIGNRDQLAALSMLTILLLLVGSIIGFGFVAWYATAAAPSVQSGITAFGVALAAFIVGALLGVLFGIPRTMVPVADSSENGNQAGNYRRQLFATNTNLEEVSDWLTKIIVGVGLIQFKAIIAQIEMLVNFLSAEIGQGTQAFALALIIYFPGLGFVAGYLWSRIVFFQIVTAVTEGDNGNVE